MRKILPALLLCFLLQNLHAQKVSDADTAKRGREVLFHMKFPVIADSSRLVKNECSNGKITGLHITASKKDNGTRIGTHCAGSITNTTPILFVIDGVPLSDGEKAFLRLNPKDIESVDILKPGTQAAFCHGPQNAVVIITTKRPQVEINVLDSTDGSQISFATVELRFKTGQKPIVVKPDSLGYFAIRKDLPAAVDFIRISAAAFKEIKIYPRELYGTRMKTVKLVRVKKPGVALPQWQGPANDRRYHTFNSHMIITPNPAQPGGRVHLRFTVNAPGAGVIYLSSISGGQVQQYPISLAGSLQDTDIDLPSAMPAGLYLIHIKNSGGAALLQQRLIVQ